MVLTLALLNYNFQIDSSIRNMEKKLLSIDRKKIDKPHSTNLEYEESLSNDFEAQMPMFTKLESSILLLLFSKFDTIHNLIFCFGGRSADTNVCVERN